MASRFSGRILVVLMDQLVNGLPAIGSPQIGEDRIQSQNVAKIHKSGLISPEIRLVYKRIFPTSNAPGAKQFLALEISPSPPHLWRGGFQFRPRSIGVSL
jgi:hypothetical protein